MRKRSSQISKHPEEEQQRARLTWRSNGNTIGEDNLSKVGERHQPTRREVLHDPFDRGSGDAGPRRRSHGILGLDARAEIIDDAPAGRRRGRRAPDIDYVPRSDDQVDVGRSVGKPFVPGAVLVGIGTSAADCHGPGHACLNDGACIADADPGRSWYEESQLKKRI